MNAVFRHELKRYFVSPAGYAFLILYTLMAGVIYVFINIWQESSASMNLTLSGMQLSLMLALTICRGYLSGMLLAPLVAWLIRWKVPPEYRIEAQRWFRKMRGTRDFTSIIESAERINPFRYETSRPTRAGKGS